MKEALLGFGAAAGFVLTGLGAFIVLGFRADNSDADALAGAVRLFIGWPALAVGVPMLALCIWGLVK